MESYLDRILGNKLIIYKIENEEIKEIRSIGIEGDGKYNDR